MERVQITAESAELARAEARLPRWMLGATVVAASAAFRFAGGPFTAAFLLGASIALLNYFWLHQAVRTLAAGPTGRMPKGVVAKFLLRYPLAFAGVYALYRTGWLPVQGIFMGLFVPVTGVLMEGVLQIWKGFRFATDL